MEIFSIILVGHTLQQGNVVSFQHDPPWEDYHMDEDQKRHTNSVSSLLDKAQSLQIQQIPGKTDFINILKNTQNTEVVEYM